VQSDLDLLCKRADVGVPAAQTVEVLVLNGGDAMAATGAGVRPTLVGRVTVDEGFKTTTELGNIGRIP